MTKMICILMLALVATIVQASTGTSLNDLHHGEPVFYKQKTADGHHYYAGVYKGVCYFDGIYYSAENEIVLCSNKRPSRLACPRGTRNNDLVNYVHGHYYGRDDFCNINLLSHKSAYPY